MKYPFAKAPFSGRHGRRFECTNENRTFKNLLFFYSGNEISKGYVMGSLFQELPLQIPEHDQNLVDHTPYKGKYF